RRCTTPRAFRRCDDRLNAVNGLGDGVDEDEYTTIPHTDTSPCTPASGSLPDPPLGVDCPQRQNDHERFLDEQLCIYHSCPECCQPQGWCACHLQGDAS